MVKPPARECVRSLFLFLILDFRLGLSRALFLLLRFRSPITISPIRLPRLQSVGPLSGSQHETIFAGLPSLRVDNSDVVNSPNRAAHRTVGEDCPLRGHCSFSRWFTRGVGPVYRRNHIEAGLYSDDIAKSIRCNGQPWLSWPEDRCRPGLVARLQNRRALFHRRRERSEATLDGKC